MPSITDTLDRIAHEADQIKSHAKRSERPPGPITSAVLYLPNPYRPSPSILSLIREATPAERRPFDVYSDDTAGPSTAPRRDGDHQRSYQRLEPHQLTPLRTLRAQKGTPHELEATLNAAEEVIGRLADGFHPMRRARKQVSDYAAQHATNAARIAELQARLGALSSKGEAEGKQQPKEEAAPALSIDEAIAAEEDALRALEASIAPLRRAAAVKAEAARSPPPKRSPARPRVSPKASPVRSPRVQHSPSASTSTSTRKSPLTPRRQPPPQPASPSPATPKATPRRPVQNRFTPLHTQQYTPRARLAPGPAPPGSTIVDRMRASITPAQASAYKTSRTLRPAGSTVEPSPAPPPPLASSPARPPVQAVAQESPVRETPGSGKARTVDGVPVDLPYVLDAVATIHRTLPTLMQMCVGVGEVVAATPEATTTHLIKVSRAEPDDAAPSSPGGTITSSLPGNSAPTHPVTRDAIVTAHICLILLRHARATEPGVAYPDMLASLKAIDKARGWDTPDAGIAKWVPRAQGARVVVRDWAKKGAVRFA